MFFELPDGGVVGLEGFLHPSGEFEHEAEVVDLGLHHKQDPALSLPIVCLLGLLCLFEVHEEVLGFA